MALVFYKGSGVTNFTLQLNVLKNLVSSIKKELSTFKNDLSEIKSIEDSYSRLVEFYNMEIKHVTEECIEKFFKIKKDYEFAALVVDRNMPDLVNQLMDNGDNMVCCIQEIQNNVNFLQGIIDCAEGWEMDNYAADLNNISTDLEQLAYAFQNDGKKREFWRLRRLILNRLKGIKNNIFEQFVINMSDIENK